MKKRITCAKKAEKKAKKERGTAGKLLLFSALLLVLGSFVMLDVLFGTHEKGAISIVIPDLLGKREDAIEEDAYLAYERVYRYDAATEAGTVIAQSPLGGSRRKLTERTPTCTVRLTVSLGEESVTVPDLCGTDAREAAARLRELGLSVREERRESAYPEGCVLRTEPRAETRIHKGGTVTLTVSAGVPTESVTVPDLCGLSKSDALMRLWLAKLSLGEVYETDSEAPTGQVVRQSHRAGTVVVAGTRVDLTFSRAGVE